MAILDRWRKKLAVKADLREGARGWAGWPAGSADRGAGERQRLYADALQAWRENPYAKRIIDLITDYTVGDGLTPLAPGEMGRFIDTFWHHPQNRLDLRLPELVDELSRAGDLFLALFRNPADGMSYVRAVPKSEIVEIVTAANDWEREMAYLVTSDELRNTKYEIRDTMEEALPSELVSRLSDLVSGGRVFLSPHHPEAATAEAVMVHYSINRPVGALLGESELAAVLPWLRHYSRMLEDRVRLNWAARAFLWFVNVPSGRVQEKAEQYAAPPEPGSIVVHDDGETWSMQAPNLHGIDARHDLRALRQAIAAGSGQPPHWHGDGGELNRAVAQAMQDPALRRLRRRQQHARHLVVDLCHTVYSRAYEIGRARRRPDDSLIRVDLPDISREDNESLARSAERLTAAFGHLSEALPGWSPTLAGQMLTMIFKFAGEPVSPGLVGMILEELKDTRYEIRNTTGE